MSHTQTESLPPRWMFPVRASLCAVLSWTAFATGDPSPLRPRPAVADYPVQASEAGLTLGAARLSPAEVRSQFATDLNHGYLVLEVGAYPAAGAKADLNPDDFFLRVGGERYRPATPQAIAAALGPKPAPPPSPRSPVTVYPTVDIGYSSGNVYDPTTGRGRGRGVYTGAGVGVGIGDPGYPSPPRPASTVADRQTMQTELEDKALRAGPLAQPVAGYLYFPLPTAKRKAVAYELEYHGTERAIRLPLPSPR